MSRPNRFLAPLLGLGVAALIGATPAMADGAGAYFEMGGFGHWLDAPASEEWSLAVIRPGGRNSPSAEDDIDSWGVGARAQAGIGLPEGLLPAGAMLELGGSWFHNEEDANNDQSFGGPGFLGGTGGLAGFLVLPVSGAYPTTPAMVVPGPPFGVRVRSDFGADVDHWDLRLQTSIPLDLGESVSAKARIGLLGGAMDQDTALTQDVDQRFLAICCAVFNLYFQNDIDVEIDSWFLGPVLGGAVTLELVENIRFTLDAEVALLYHDADMRIEQTWFTRFGGTTARSQLHETDDEDHFNARSRLAGTLEVDLGPVLLRLNGAFNYWTYAPYAKNPRLPPLFPPNSSSGSPASSRLSSADMMSAEAGASIVIPF